MVERFFVTIGDGYNLVAAGYNGYSLVARPVKHARIRPWPAATPPSLLIYRTNNELEKSSDSKKGSACRHSGVDGRRLRIIRNEDGTV